MPRFLPEPALPFAQQQRTAVLLLNLGTPAAPTAAAVRPYLREFLSDARVVELPQWLWQPILQGPVLTLRPKKSAHGRRRAPLSARISFRCARGGITAMAVAADSAGPRAHFAAEKKRPRL